MQRRGGSLHEPSGQSFLSDRYDTAIFCFSKGLPFLSGVPSVPHIPFVPAKEAKNRPTLSMRVPPDWTIRQQKSGLSVGSGFLPIGHKSHHRFTPQFDQLTTLGHGIIVRATEQGK